MKILPSHPSKESKREREWEGKGRKGERDREEKAKKRRDLDGGRIFNKLQEK